MIGVSRTVADNKSVSFEYLRLMQIENGIIYIAQASDGTANEFKLVELGDEEATFANPVNDFPRHIIYHKEVRNTLFLRLEGIINGQLSSKDFRYRHIKN